MISYFNLRKKNLWEFPPLRRGKVRVGVNEIYFNLLEKNIHKGAGNEG
jgi:hypothetical protein